MAALRRPGPLTEARLNTLLDAARPYETAAVDDVRSRTRELAAARPTTIVA
ncbi:hypothetical protein [Streptomyces sp. NPDC004065]|uniref:hypothetical protein n=1 Tax=Streptomyces sp. NPDC004065 TaxID=3364689 RepID=UPI00384B08DF